MRKLLTLILSAVIFFSCNSGNKEKTVAEPAADEHKEHLENKGGLALNNGAKWKADSITLVNVASLGSIVSNAKKESLESYTQTASQLESGLNKMIAECKMQGADHDALHQWLEPLIEKTSELKKATTVENASGVLGEIRKQLDLFPQYFE